MRLSKVAAYGVSIVISTSLLAACSGSMTPSAPSSLSNSAARVHVPHGVHFAHGMPLSLIPPNVGVRKLHLPVGNERPIKMMKPPKGGLYGSFFYGLNTSDTGYIPSVYGYPNPNSGNNPPTCSIPMTFVNGFGVDPEGNTMVPGFELIYYTAEAIIYAGPYLCGGASQTVLGAIADSGGQPAAASSQDAATGSIAIGELVNYTSDTGDVLVCTIASGCGAPLSNSSVYPDSYAAGVAIDKKGNCWESGYAEEASAEVPALFYWPGCSGNALVATGVNQTSYGDVKVDASGNIVTDDFSSNIYVYSCKYSKPAKKNGYTASENCTLLSTTPMQGESLFFGLGKKDGNLVAGDFENGTVDVYSYSPTGSTYQYSFNNGLSGGYDVEAGADSPAAK